MRNPTVADLSKFLLRLVQGHSDERTLRWLEQQQEKLQQGSFARPFYLAFSMAPRFTPRAALLLTPAQQETAHQLRAGFQPDGWPLSQLVRSYLLLQLPTDDPSRYVRTLTQLLETAEVDEQVAVYATLPLLPHPEALVPLAVNGLRTNITRVFDAITLRNPYPTDYLDEPAWNQMILKAIFMERPLYPIYEADRRANPALARMLVDFAHERWAADRPVTPELWRFVAPYTDASHYDDLARVVASDRPAERAAGQRACARVEELQSLLPHDYNANHLPTWEQIGKMSEG